MRTSWALLIPVALAAAFSAGAAKAADSNGQYDDSPYKDWFSQQYNKHGGWCCNLGDGHRYDGNYTVNPDGSVTLNGTPNIVIDAYKVLDGSTLVMPDGEITGGPNPTGHAILWSSHLALNADGSNVYCFSPGLLD